MTDKVEDVVGVNEIAELANVSKQTVANWRARWTDFPEPMLALASGPIFRRSQIIGWMAGRRDLMPDRCPICLGEAERGRDVDYGDKKQVRCERCGPFTISGTALAMLSTRVDEEPLARARLSHAIRTSTSEKNWLFISSANLDELVRHPLPDVERQLENFTIWLASQLGDDRLGRAPHPWPESLAGVIGCSDGVRVERLIDYGVNQGVIVRDDEHDLLGLTPEGWKVVELPVADEEDRSDPNETDVRKAHCNTCGGQRSAYIRGSHTVNDSDNETSWSNKVDILECCGCHSISVQRTDWFSEWDYVDADPISGEQHLVRGEEVTYWPPQTRRKKPEWVADLSDDTLRRTYDEVYQALNSGLIVLASIGTRTLLDRAMFLRVGDPKNGFNGKLDHMVGKGHIGKDERKVLETITDAGSASAHRGFSPLPKTLDTIIETTENFLHREFVLKSAVSRVKEETPPRRS